MIRNNQKSNFRSENTMDHGADWFNPLDGLYNLSMTVVSTFSGAPEINEEQYTILKGFLRIVLCPKLFQLL